PASAAVPPCWKLVAPLRTVSASRWPWMSSVWRIWIRSAASAPFAGAADGAASGVHPRAIARTSPARARTGLYGGFMGAVLELVEPVVHAALAEEVAVGPHLDDASLVEHDDAVDVLDGREAVGDDDRGPSGHQLREGVLDEMLRLGVHRAGRLVEHEEDLGVERDRAAEREQ